MSIILRQNKGSELTFNEVDENFSSMYYSSSLVGSTLNFYFTGSNPQISESIDLSTLPGMGGVQIYYDNTQVNYAQSFYFTGSGVDVTSLPGGGVLINVPEADAAGGSNMNIQFASGSALDLELSGSNNFKFNYFT